MKKLVDLLKGFRGKQAVVLDSKVSMFFKDLALVLVKVIFAVFLSLFDLMLGLFTFGQA